MLLFATCVLGCRPSPQFQQHYNIPDGQWSSAFQPSFQFDISDTSAAYQLFLLIRHTDAYPFSNLWMTMESRGPVDSGFKKLRVEVPLAAPSGQWLGRGMGEIWEQRVPINSLQMPAFFPKPGLYTVRLTQDMRRDPLPEVLTIGLRIEKLPPFHKEKE
ncbi:MAG: gliding motility lipoprotein GldH [Bacteroidetes bacterium]|nr:gliding motility lipoprotein GldH [Bacteroidota bacterium]